MNKRRKQTAKETPLESLSASIGLSRETKASKRRRALIKVYRLLLSLDDKANQQTGNPTDE